MVSKDKQVPNFKNYIINKYELIFIDIREKRIVLIYSLKGNQPK